MEQGAGVSASVTVQHQWPDGSRVTARVTVATSYPDALSEARAEMVAEFSEGEA